MKPRRRRLPFDLPTIALVLLACSLPVLAMAEPRVTLTRSEGVATLEEESIILGDGGHVLVPIRRQPVTVRARISGGSFGALTDDEMAEVRDAALRCEDPAHPENLRDGPEAADWLFRYDCVGPAA